MTDIAVIGAGVGGLAASARLATAGYEVTVYERTGTYGGALRSYERDGFRFDTGPGLLHLPAVYRDLFLKTGREPLEDCVELVRTEPAARHVFADGTDVSLPGSSRAAVIAALDGALGTGAGERWSDLLARARTAWDATRRPLLEEPSTGAAEAPFPGGDPYPALRRRGLAGLPGLRGRRARGRRAATLADVAARELRDPRLVALLTSYAHAHGLDPDTAPASATALAYMEHTFGSWYVRGGMRALARALYERCVKRGVQFRFGAEVLRVREENRRAVGLELTGGVAVATDVVVSGAARLPGEDPSTDEAARTSGTAARGGRQPTRDGDWQQHARSRLTVLLALRGARPSAAAHRTIVHRADAPRQPLTLLRPDDPALTPDGDHESAVLSVPVRAAEVPDRVHTERLADQLLAAADTAEPGLSERVLWREVRTPQDNAAETGAPDGLVAPPALAGTGGGASAARAANRSPANGLYRAGSWAHPGGGLAHAGMSGALVAGLIVEGDDWRGSR